jgi:hypothetical protein
MSLQAYANRKYDYLALRDVKNIVNARLGLELFNSRDNGQICTGIQKLSQRWLLEFMTEAGSMPGRPDRGSGFMTAARQGRILNALGATAAFESAAIAIRRNLQNEETPEMPDDERFLSTELLAVAILPGYLQLRVKINSLAGNNREIILPVSVLPTNI